MVKKVKRFIVFVVFSFFYSLFTGNEVKADYSLRVYPKTNGHVALQGDDSGKTVAQIEEILGY